MRAPRFKCLFCKHCCYFGSEAEYPTVYPWEKRRLEELAKREGIELKFEPLFLFRERGAKDTCIVLLYRWLVPGFCPFFDKDTKRCRIHDKKPLACKMYPLMVEMPTGNLMISAKCDWVRNQGLQIVRLLESRPRLIPRVFPAEYEAAKEAFAQFTTYIRIAEELGLEPLPVSEKKKCRAFYDLDIYTEKRKG